MKYYKAEILAQKGIKETYLIITDTIGDTEDKAYQLFKMRHPKKILSEIISLDVVPFIVHATLI